MGKSKIVQDAEKLFTLADAERRFEVSALELHQRAAAGDIELCVRVPDGCAVYSVDPASLQIDNPAYLLPISRFVNTVPSPVDPFPISSKLAIQALVVSRLTCIITLPVESLPSMSTAQELFSSGFSSEPTGQVGKQAGYVRLLPQWPGSEHFSRGINSEQWCFAVYPTGHEFQRTITTWSSSGFQAPVSLDVRHESLLVAESEVQKVLSLRASNRHESKPVESDSQDIPEVVEQGPVALVPEPEQPLPAAPANHAPVTEPVIHLPRKFLRIEEVEGRIGVKRSTIYSRMAPSSKYFDPTFPRQIRLGNGSGPAVWDEAELNAWMAAQLETRSNG